MSAPAVPAAPVDLQASPRAVSRRRAIPWFRWSILGPLIVLLAVVLMPVLFLQLYFSFHQWSVYLGSWSDAEYVGLDLFREVLTDPRFGWAVVRSLSFATGSTIGCFLVVDVAFDGLQASPRYPAGMALRFARIKGYRHDKRAEDADTIDTVRAIFKGSATG